MSVTNKTKRAYVWVAICYCEHAETKDQASIARLLENNYPGLAYWLSPVHNPDNDEKKEHIHVILRFDSLKSLSQVNEITQKLLLGTCAIECASLRGYVRYLCHLDNQNKQQWDESPETLIMCGGDARISPYLQERIDISDESFVSAEIEQFIDDNDLRSYAVLCRYARANNPTWHSFLVKKSGRSHIFQYLRSCDWEK